MTASWKKRLQWIGALYKCALWQQNAVASEIAYSNKCVLWWKIWPSKAVLGRTINVVSATPDKGVFLSPRLSHASSGFQPKSHLSSCGTYRTLAKNQLKLFVWELLIDQGNGGSQEATRISSCFLALTARRRLINIPATLKSPQFQGPLWPEPQWWCSEDPQLQYLTTDWP